ncbi:putative gluconokinase [Branchiostoma floridae x Branchiostoma belcheri]
MIVVLMGVCGCGKTSVGQALAEKLSWEFADADLFHPYVNKQKMSAGVPLTDEDRYPWLRKLHAVIYSWISEGRSGVLACSALKRLYRQVLVTEGVRRSSGVVWRAGLDTSCPLVCWTLSFSHWRSLMNLKTACLSVSHNH